MSERTHYPPGVPCWVETLQPDPDAATRFYAELFGWQYVGPGPMPGEPPGRYFVARLRGRDVAGVGTKPAQAAPPGAFWATHISVESVERAAAQASDAGGAVLVAPFDVAPAGRMAVLRDPAGATFCVWEAEERRGAELVNEPKAWAMSSLITRDPDRARSFYARLFNWQTESLDAGENAMYLCRLSGYVGGEPQQPVPRDVVAVMLPACDTLPDNRAAEWSVDFWIDNADAATLKASALGAAVLVPPYDVPGFRRATIADPQGAVFSISQLRY
jgi:uncharacterized protein